MVNPALLEAKLLIQELWQRKLERDNKLPIVLLKRWIKWKSSLNELDKYKYQGGMVSSKH